MLYHKLEHSCKAVLLCILIVLCTAVTVTTTNQMMNITIEVPNGTTTHGVPNLLCFPPKWTDIFVFYVGNYFAHAATIKPYPGEQSFGFILNMLLAFLFPTFGTIRALNSIVRCSILAEDPLERATRSGALCMVARAHDWKPKVQDSVRAGLEYHEFPRISVLVGSQEVSADIPWDAVPRRYRELLQRWFIVGLTQQFPGITRMTEIQDQSRACSFGPVLQIHVPKHLRDPSVEFAFTDTSSFYVQDRDVFGDNQLPEGYRYAYVPFDAIVDYPENLNRPAIFSTYSLTMPLVALAQSLYASYTLYLSRGDQIRQYGYAAFGLTVAPYAIMSSLNIVGNLTTPQYNAMFLVDTDVMQEAIKRGGRFSFVVGRINAIEEATASRALVNIGIHADQDSIRLHPCPGGSPVPYSFLSQFSTQDNDSFIVKLQSYVDKSLISHWQIVVPACPKIERRSELATSRRFFGGFTFFTVHAAVLAIIGGLSHFEKGESTVSQRAWTVTWLVLGFVAGLTATKSSQRIREIMWPIVLSFQIWERNTRPINPPSIQIMILTCKYLMIFIGTNPKAFQLLVAIVLGAPAIGGLIVVGEMLREYGSCKHF